jgi:hypothetical protein
MKFQLISLLAFAQISIGLGQNNMSSAIRQLERDLTDRTEAFNADTLICQIENEQMEIGELKAVDFYFWYAMATNEPIGFQGMLDLEQALFNAIADDLLWCWHAEGFDQSQVGNRKLLEAESSRKQRFIKEARDLGIVAFEQGSLDYKTGCKCLNSVYT